MQQPRAQVRGDSVVLFSARLDHAHAAPNYVQLGAYACSAYMCNRLVVTARPRFPVRSCQTPSNVALRTPQCAPPHTHRLINDTVLKIASCARHTSIDMAEIALELEAAVAVPWSDVPGSAVKRIMRHVPQRHRLGHGSSCALVCSSWAQAAAAATDSIVLEGCADTESLQLWLRKHGHSLSKLHVRADSGMLTQLPCPKLADLLLQGDSLLSAPNLTAVVSALPSLQHLSFSSSCQSGSYHVPTVSLPHGLLQ